MVHKYIISYPGLHFKMGMPVRLQMAAFSWLCKHITSMHIIRYLFLNNPFRILLKEEKFSKSKLIWTSSVQSSMPLLLLDDAQQEVIYKKV